MRLRLRLFAFVFLLPTLTGCPETAPPDDAGPSERPEILDVVVPSPAVEGSILEVRGLGLDLLGDSQLLEITEGGAVASTLNTSADLDEGRLLFELSSDAVSQLGNGVHNVDLRLRGDGPSSLPFPIELRIVGSLAVDLFEVPEGEVHRNDVEVVNGAGMIGPTEGTLEARFLGTFTADAGGDTPVDVRLPVTPLERNDRERGVVVLTTELGGLQPGTFAGTVQLFSTLRSGDSSESLSLTTSFHFNPPDLYGLDPIDASVGQILTVVGAGFLGGRGDETTLLRLEGMFTPQGSAPVAFGPVEIVPVWVSGTEVQLLLEPDIRGDQVVSDLFGYARGSFAGTATPITIKGVEELEGVAVPFGFNLGALQQVIYVHFLPGFFDSLALFGLGDAAPEIEAAVQARMEAIYLPWAVDLRFEEPDDYSRTAYSVVEVGGPDPNGVGLFGYDNSPGKDIGNLRLFDSIGGTNAETQMDGFPGFGGVFVESFLYWSEHPDLPGDPPGGAPNPDPLFDMIFDPVRMNPATRAEARGEGDASRVAEVQAAISALGSIIGETTSHEIGHSLGMAQPYGSPTVYHNDFNGDGCLMDSGGDRPIGERMALSGFDTTTFCYDHPEYMDEILSR